MPKTDNGKELNAIMSLAQVDAIRRQATLGTALCVQTLDLCAMIKVLASVIRDAYEDVGNWGAYADDYFKKKWDLDGDIERYKTVLDKLSILKEDAQ